MLKQKFQGFILNPKIILAIFAIFGVSIFISELSEKPPTQEEIAQKEKRELTSSIELACRVFINKNLNDPDSAVYDNNPIILEQKPGIWFVQENLRARNVFNALIKTSYVCLIKDEGEKFELLELNNMDNG